MAKDDTHTTGAREFTLARLAAARGPIGAASGMLDEALGLFVEPENDKKGSRRSELLEAIDEALGAAARAVQAAQVSWSDVDPKEGEPDYDLDDDDDDDDDDEDDDEDEDEDEDDEDDD